MVELDKVKLQDTIVMSTSGLIENIYIKDGYLKEALTIGAFQIKSPFYDELTVVGVVERIFEVTSQTRDNYLKRTNKLKKILKQIEKLNEERNTKINIIVFPEYCFPPEMVNSIKDFTNKTKIIVVGNYYNKKERASISFVCLPKGWSEHELYESKKITISDYDKDVLGEVSQNERKILKFWWRPEDKKIQGYVQILTCKDFLYFTSIAGIKNYPDCIDIDHAGIIIIPMSTPEIALFENKASSIIREVELDTGAKSIVSVLCNGTDLLHHQTGAGICGQTQFVSPLDLKRYEKIILPKGFESCLLAQINPFKAIVKPTPIVKGPNAVVYSIIKYRIDNESNLIPEDLPKGVHTGVIINPYIFQYLGLKKIYALMVVNDYCKLKETLSNIPIEYLNTAIGIHGIYGYHDILIQSYEQVREDEAKKCLELRLWPLIQEEKFFAPNFFGYSIVQIPIKVHGIRLDKIKPIDKVYCSIFYDKKDYFRKIVGGEEVSPQELDKLIEMQICLKTPYDLSDITEKEINENKLEFLILIEVIGTDEYTSTQDIKQIFKKELLDNIIDDDRIRTIEQIHSSGEALVRANFLLHIVGTVDELNEILIGKILGNSSTKFKCKTQVILPAEKILKNKFPILLENFVDPFTEKHVIELMDDCKNYMEKNCFINPFAINMIDPDNREKILDTYRLFEEARSKYYLKDMNFNKKDMFEFTYALCDLLSKKKVQNEDDKIFIDTYKNFIDTSTRFIVTVARKIEDSLKSVFKRIIENNNISNEDFNELLNLVIKAKSGKDGNFKYPLVEIGTTQFALRMSDGIINDKKSVEKFREILRLTYSDASNKDEIITQKEDLAKKIYRDLVFYFGQTSEDTMKITIMNLDGFSKLRNMIAHEKPINRDDLPNIPTHVYGGLKYLIFINKKNIETSTPYLAELSEVSGNMPDSFGFSNSG